jgi:glycosyltransferase involved in cell wall biosynthesis
MVCPVLKQPFRRTSFAMPYFSITMPAYNRQREIRRAIESCLAQDYGDFEIVVVDGASTDDTVAVVTEFSRTDPRIRLIREARSRGVCPARNTAAAAARGEWMVLLDTDQALQPGALATMQRLTASAPPDVGNVAARVAWDTGLVTPGPTLANGPLGYEEYIAWIDTLAESEWFNCIRRQVWLEGVKWPDSRASEGGFNLNLAARWRFEIHPEICSIYYTDSVNSFCHPKSAGSAKRVLMRDALDHGLDAEASLRKHGPLLAKHAPRLFYLKHYMAARGRFVAGHRRMAMKYWLKCLELRPLSPHLWFLGPLGLINRYALGYAYCWAKYSLPAYRQMLHKQVAPVGSVTAGSPPTE